MTKKDRQALREKWRRDTQKDTIREARMDEIRLRVLIKEIKL